MKSNGDKTYATAIQEIGSLINQARQKKGMTIESLAESIKIGCEQLIALEKGEVDLLPELVFIKGMIRRIAEKLNLDAEVLIKKVNMKTDQEIVNESLKPKKNLIRGLFNFLKSKRDKLKDLKLVSKSTNGNDEDCQSEEFGVNKLNGKAAGGKWKELTRKEKRAKEAEEIRNSDKFVSVSLKEGRNKSPKEKLLIIENGLIKEKIDIQKEE